MPPLREALKEQYHAGLAMLADCIRRCPEDLWSAPNPPSPVPQHPENSGWNVERPFWRIAFHAVYFTHLYLGQGTAAFERPPISLKVGQRPDFSQMWSGDIEPYELPEGAEPLTKQDLLDYLAYVDSLVDPTVDTLDLDTEESGFHWYKNISKLSHQLLNLRHVQGHVGQLSELLMLKGIDSTWISKPRATVA